MNENISSRQIILLITICRITTILTVMSTIYMPPANQDIWIIIIISFFYTILTSIPILFLSNKFNNMTIIKYMEKVFGKAIGKLIGISYGMLFVAVGILFSYITIQMIRASFLTDTYPFITIFFLISCCIYFGSKSIGVIAKSSELFVPVILAVITFFIFLGYNKIDLTVLLPIYRDSTFLSINYGSILLSYIFVDIHILPMILPQMENKKDLNKVFIKSVFYSLAFILMVVVATQTSLGVEQAKHSNFPFLDFIRLINVFSIFERIESIYIVMWMIAMIIKITVYIYIASKAFAETFGRKFSNIFIYIVGAVVGLITYYIAEFRPLLLEISSIKPLEYTVYIIFKTGIPLIAVIVYFFRRKSLDKQANLKG